MISIEITMCTINESIYIIIMSIYNKKGFNQNSKSMLTRSGWYYIAMEGPKPLP